MAGGESANSPDRLLKTVGPLRIRPMREFTLEALLLSKMMELKKQLDSIYFEFEEQPSSEVAEMFSSDWVPLVDITEDEHGFLLEADLPGVREEDIEVCYDHDTLTVRGRRRENSPGEGAAYLCFERTVGSFFRRIPLPPTTNVNAIEASLDRGVLTITLPKVPERRGRSFQVPVVRRLTRNTLAEE
jgi:HSP20 family protein